MSKGIAFQGYVPIRTEPSDSSEMGSQVLFGERFQILDSTGQWLHISLDFDGFEGWVRRECITLLGPENRSVKESTHDYRMVMHSSVAVQDLILRRQLLLPAGSLWPQMEGNAFTLEDRDFEFPPEEKLVTPGSLVDPEEMGKNLLTVPHLMGGRCGFGFDCAGLVQIICRTMGIFLPRGIRQQSELGITINFLHEIQKGDLAFFDDESAEINHVGILLKNGWILHSFDQVRIDRVDQQGIFNMEREKYTHKLRIIKRIER